MELIQIWN